jgi:hypothetical protein
VSKPNPIDFQVGGETSGQSGSIADSWCIETWCDNWRVGARVSNFFSVVVGFVLC